jgi:actin related protein 2/3 complex subunit 3
LWFEIDKEDIIDEAINYFKANVFFRNFEVKGAADRVLIYLTLYISACLNKIAPTDNKSSAEKNMYQLAIENFSLPGDKTFALGGIVTNPANRGESGMSITKIEESNVSYCLSLNLSQSVQTPFVNI